MCAAIMLTRFSNPIYFFASLFGGLQLLIIVIGRRRFKKVGTLTYTGSSLVIKIFKDELTYAFPVSEEISLELKFNAKWLIMNLGKTIGHLRYYNSQFSLSTECFDKLQIGDRQWFVMLRDAEEVERFRSLRSDLWNQREE